MIVILQSLRERTPVPGAISSALKRSSIQTHGFLNEVGWFQMLINHMNDLVEGRLGATHLAPSFGVARRARSSHGSASIAAHQLCGLNRTPEFALAAFWREPEHSKADEQGSDDRE